jgi:ribosome-associated protein
MIRINRTTTVPDSDIRFTFSTSSKPGGQNVNKVHTRVTLNFDLAGTSSLSAGQKALIGRKLPGRINQEGIFKVSSQKYRTREANRKAAVARFRELISKALEIEKPRKRTSVPASVRRKRLEDKRRRSLLKKSRMIKKTEDD